MLLQFGCGLLGLGRFWFCIAVDVCVAVVVGLLLVGTHTHTRTHTYTQLCLFRQAHNRKFARVCKYVHARVFRVLVGRLKGMLVVIYY